MSTNVIKNEIEGLGAVTFEVDDSVISSITMNLDDEQIEAIVQSGGMTGLKYRFRAQTFVATRMLETMGDEVARMSNMTKRLAFASLSIAIGMFLGTTSNCETIKRNVDGELFSGDESKNVVNMAFNIVTEVMRTYVNEKEAGTDTFPSVKFPSCMPDYTLIGITILVRTKYTTSQLAELLMTAFWNWPDLFKKQFFGNFAIGAEFQMEHMAWEKSFWEKTVGTTRNTNNSNFSRKFTPRFYQTSVTDYFLPFLPDGRIVVPANRMSGFTKAEFVKVMVTIHDQVVSKAGFRYGGGVLGAGTDNLFTNVATARNAVGTSNTVISVAELAYPASLNATMRGRITNLAATVPTTEMMAMTTDAAEFNMLRETIRTNNYPNMNQAITDFSS